MRWNSQLGRSYLQASSGYELWSCLSVEFGGASWLYAPRVAAIFDDATRLAWATRHLASALRGTPALDPQLHPGLRLIGTTGSANP